MNSIWSEDVKRKAFPTLKDDLTCDVLVVGGGLCGVLTAHKLSLSGLKVVLLERDRLGSGQSALTTAKATLAHGEIYSKISREFCKSAAEIYAECGRLAIEEYRKIVKSEHIDCELEMQSAYLYSLYGERHVMAEYEAAKEAGVNCSVVYDTTLPFEVKAAVKYPSQCVFHPLKLIYGLTRGFDIYESSPVTQISGGKAFCPGGSVSAKSIVIATNYPSAGDTKLLFPLKLHRKMAHVCAFSGVAHLGASFIGIDGGYNYRSYGDTLIVSGENHVSGEGVPGAYERITRDTETHFKGARFLKSWSAEDSTTVDTLPYIGRIKSGENDLLVATGFRTWGMTMSMTAACLLRDLILGHHNPAEELFSPSRLKLSAASGLGGMITRSAKGIIASRLTLPEDELGKLPRGTGKIVMHMGKKVAAYVDDEGNPHVCEPYCPHRKCELKWNFDDKTWDCPCHGSRFDVDGSLLTGPATRKI